MSKSAHTHPQRYLRKHDRVVGPKKNDNKSNKAAKTTSKRRKGEKVKRETEQKANRPITGQQANRPTRQQANKATDQQFRRCLILCVFRSSLSSLQNEHTWSVCSVGNVRKKRPKRQQDKRRRSDKKVCLDMTRQHKAQHKKYDHI